jgi:hypothetical protein
MITNLNLLKFCESLSDSLGAIRSCTALSLQIGFYAGLLNLIIMRISFNLVCTIKHIHHSNCCGFLTTNVVCVWYFSFNKYLLRRDKLFWKSWPFFQFALERYFYHKAVRQANKCQKTGTIYVCKGWSGEFCLIMILAQLSIGTAHELLKIVKNI